MKGHKLGRAPNLTNACIAMFGVNLAWIMVFLLAVYGLLAAILVALLINYWVSWLEQRRFRTDLQTKTDD
ncbi:MAG: hypothetical protein ABJL72_18245 [Roseobacter sp.]